MAELTVIVSACIAVLALVAFAVLYGWAIWGAWRSASPPTANAVYVATALAGLVGGFVAAAFGQQLPKSPNSIAQFIQSGFSSAGKLATASPPDQSTSPTSQPSTQPASRLPIRQWIGAAYIILYFLAGGAAAVTWVFAPTPVPDLIRNLAMIVLGLMIAIAGTYMRMV